MHKNKQRAGKGFSSIERGVLVSKGPMFLHRHRIWGAQWWNSFQKRHRVPETPKASALEVSKMQNGARQMAPKFLQVLRGLALQNRSSAPNENAFFMDGEADRIIIYRQYAISLYSK